MKKVSISAKPTAKPGHHTPDKWVKDRQLPATEPTKRFTVDVPVSLHQRFKSRCALRGVQMADVIRELLERDLESEYQGRGLDEDSSST